MSPKEERELQRMMDITRATLYFAKGALLVEGLSESLLVPVLARRLGHDLAKLHVSVIPICGVAFETFKKILDPSVFGIPVAMVTDSDAPIVEGPTWEADIPARSNGGFTISDRTAKLVSIFGQHSTVKVFHSQLTLEYDLAEAGDDNAVIMAEVWESCFDRCPGTFNVRRVTSAGSARRDKAIVAWRGICRASHSGSKAELSHRLAARLDGSDGSGSCPLRFVVPAYIKSAIEHVVAGVNPPAGTTGATVP
jgi:putative ATP-dependent endonuclease of OLD family